MICPRHCCSTAAGATVECDQKLTKMTPDGGGPLGSSSAGRWGLGSGGVQLLPSNMSSWLGFKSGCNDTFLCPLYPRKRTCAAQLAMSALAPIATEKADFRERPCLLHPRKRTCAAQTRHVCFGPEADIATYSMTSSARACLRSFKIDHQLVLGRLLNRKVGRFFALEDAIDIVGRATQKGMSALPTECNATMAYRTGESGQAGLPAPS